MPRNSFETSGSFRGAISSSLRIGHAARGIMPRLALLLVIRAMMADSLPWGVQDIRQTGIRSSDVEVAVLSPNGDIYLAGRPE